VFDNAGKYQYTIGVTSVAGYDNAHFGGPRAIAINASAHVYVVDSSVHRVQVFDNAGKYQFTIGETAVAGSDNAHFDFPQGIALTTTGELYISDRNNDRVQVFYVPSSKSDPEQEGIAGFSPVMLLAIIGFGAFSLWWRVRRVSHP
jgi:hypothetical protein